MSFADRASADLIVDGSWTWTARNPADLDAAIVHDELVSAAGRIGLTRREAERTIASGLTAGARHPRHR